MSTIGEAIRDRRTVIGLSKAALARAIGVDVRQMTRWESGETSISAQMALNVARALGVGVGTLLGEVPLGLDLSGAWFAAWESTRASENYVNTHELTATHSGEYAYLDAVPSEGTGYVSDYAWRADLRVMEESLVGTYRAIADRRRERGALYFVLSRAGDAAIGHWAGQWQDGILGTGYGALARTPERARRLLDSLIHHPPIPIAEWPTEEKEMADAYLSG